MASNFLAGNDTDSAPKMRHGEASSASEGCADLLRAYGDVRSATERLCEPLAIDDHLLQSMPEASPVKWHLAHTTWFFETFVLTRYLPSYQPFHAEFSVLFNSYYNAVGPRWPRHQRGLLSRPTVAEVYRYRAWVDKHIVRLLENGSADETELRARVRLGMNHEQQHQELIFTDLKHAWWANPLRPAYHERTMRSGPPPKPVWVSFPAGMVDIGHDGHGFAFDNELPRHRTFVQRFELANRLVTIGDYLEFMADGGYERPEFWLSDGWALVQAHGWQAPLYWEKGDSGWLVYTLDGTRSLETDEPLCHVSYYEADAFARWAGSRLPTEVEWEVAAAAARLAGHFLESGNFHPVGAPADGDGGPLFQLFGDVLQWTASPYVAYPGYRPDPGALGEYNGKFMCNQIVLRGASCVTPRSHARASYRNFFPPESRWQFAGLRLARDVG